MNDNAQPGNGNQARPARVIRPMKAKPRLKPNVVIRHHQNNEHSIQKVAPKPTTSGNDPQAARTPSTQQ